MALEMNQDLGQKKISLKYFLGCIDNRYGCIIIAFIDTCWMVSNFVLCVLALLKSLRNWIMRIDYYREQNTDFSGMSLASGGMIANMVSFCITMCLLYVAVRKGSQKYLLILYYLKCSLTITIEFIILYFVWMKKDANLWVRTAQRSSFAITITVCVGIIWNAYAAYIVYCYNMELNIREEVARKLYAAWKDRMIEASSKMKRRKEGDEQADNEPKKSKPKPKLQKRLKRLQ